MGEYIHEVVLQDFVVDNIADLSLEVVYNKTASFELVDASVNKNGEFWDLNGTLSNGAVIPLEVEWISSNFIAHKHNKSPDYKKFLAKNGVVVVLRKNREIEAVQQKSLTESLTDAQFIKLFKKWYRGKYEEYINDTLKDFLVGNYKRKEPRIILYPLSKKAAGNYFSNGSLYRKNNTGHFVLGFTEKGYTNNVFVQDIQPDDICIFLDADGHRCKRPEFIKAVKSGQLHIKQLTGFRITTRLDDRRVDYTGIDEHYWPDEIKKKELIYPYICRVEEVPFYDVRETVFPYINTFTDDKWEAIRSCIQYGEYKELIPMDYMSITSKLKPVFSGH